MAPAPAGYAPLIGGGDTSAAVTRPSPSSPASGLLQNRVIEAQVPAALRNAARRRGGGFFLISVVSVIAAMYFVYFVFLQVPLIRIFFADDSDSDAPTQTTRWLSLAVVLSFHTWFGLLIIALIQCSTTDPGAVPQHWGFYVGEERKRKRYCRVCNVWKPARTHHCSNCGRCVLNMDHHCPWINNCVGFFNRKFFVQLLWYGIITLMYVCIHGIYYLGASASNMWPIDYRPVYVRQSPIDYIGYTLVLIVTLFSTILLGALFPFTRFHMGLVVRNSTTIESMDIQTRGSPKFDLGARRNIEQVFGSTPSLWWLPCHVTASRPVGDGVRWNLHCLGITDEETV